MVFSLMGLIDFLRKRYYTSLADDQIQSKISKYKDDLERIATYIDICEIEARAQFELSLQRPIVAGGSGDFSSRYYTSARSLKTDKKKTEKKVELLEQILSERRTQNS